jgi:hypothetical protein
LPSKAAINTSNTDKEVLVPLFTDTDQGQITSKHPIDKNDLSPNGKTAPLVMITNIEAYNFTTGGECNQLFD